MFFQFCDHTISKLLRNHICCRPPALYLFRIFGVRSACSCATIRNSSVSFFKPIFINDSQDLLLVTVSAAERNFSCKFLFQYDCFLSWCLSILSLPTFNPLKRLPHIMVTHSNNSLLPTNCLRVFDHFVVLVLKGLICFLYELLSITFQYRSLHNSADFVSKYSVPYTPEVLFLST